jgi:hypothetical protein
MVADVTKGQEFISQRSLKNQLFADRKDDIGALNKTMTSFSSNNIKSLNALTKEMSSLNQNISKLTKPTQDKKDFVRRDDKTLKLIKEVDDLEELMQDLINIEKSKEKKGGSFLKDLLGGIGALAAGAGLLGFLLTGDAKYLRGITKGIAKLGTRLYGAIFNGVDIAIKGTKKAWSKISGFADEFLVGPVKKGWSKISGFADEFLVGPLKSGFSKVTGFADEFLVGPLKSGFSKVTGFADEFLMGMKGSFDNVLKGIGGAADNIIGKVAKSGVGKAAITGVEKAGGLLGKAGKGAGKLFGGIGKKAAGIVGKKGLAQTAKALPIVGGAVNAVFAIDKAMKGDWIGAGMELGAGAAGLLDLVAPGVGTALSTTIEVASLARDLSREFTDKEAVALEREKGLFKAIGSMFKKPEGDNKIFDDMYRILEPKSLGGIGFKINKDILKSSEYDGIKYYGDVDISGMNKNVWHNFVGMASEYFQKTGKEIQLNSAYRNPNKQKELWEKAVKEGRTGYVARPGRSLHEYGLALDMNTPDADNLEKLGLFKKWNFWRPLLQPGIKHKESWHVEPIGIDRAAVRNEPDTSQQIPKIGDRIIGNNYIKPMQNIDMNLPRNVISEKASGNKNSEKIDLSEGTINALAAAIGVSFKGAMPRPRSNNVVIDNNMRG